MAKKKVYRYWLYILARAAAALVNVLPRRAALSLARWLGRLGFTLARRWRQAAFENLNFVYGGEKSPEEIEALAKGVFENFAQTAVDILRFPEFAEKGLEGLVDYGDAVPLFRGLLGEGRGVISVTAHFGNWELLAGALAMAGFRGGVLARRIYFAPYNDWIVDLRRSLRVPTLYRDRAVRSVFDILKRNEVVGLLPDQDIDSLKGIFVPFFGREAYTPVAPAKISVKTGAPMVPAFLVREKNSAYRLIVDHVLRPDPAKGPDEAAQQLTHQWMESFERVIRQYPDQWAWMHRRWKTQPDSMTHVNPWGSTPGVDVGPKGENEPAH